MSTLGRPPLHPGQLRQAQQWLYQALAEPVGLLFHTDEPDRLVALFYQARVATKDPALGALVIKRWPENQVAVGKPVVAEADLAPRAEPARQTVDLGDLGL